MTALQKRLKEINACREAYEWVGERTIAQAWAECECPQWMLWLLLREKPDEKPAAVLLLAEQVRSRTLPHVPPEHREVCKRALDAAEAWANDPTWVNLRAVEDAASPAGQAAANATWVAAAAAASGAAKTAARAIWAAAATAICVSEAAIDFAYAGAVATAAGAAVEAAWVEERRLWCAAIRARWPEPPWKEE